MRIVFFNIVHLLLSENTVRRIVKFDQIEHFGLSKKAAVVSNFCLIGKIHHNFLVPKMIEFGHKTFMLIQTLDLHRVSVQVSLRKAPKKLGDLVKFFWSS